MSERSNIAAASGGIGDDYNSQKDLQVEITTSIDTVPVTAQRRLFNPTQEELRALPNPGMQHNYPLVFLNSSSRTV